MHCNIHFCQLLTEQQCELDSYYYTQDAFAELHLVQSLVVLGGVSSPMRNLSIAVCECPCHFGCYRYLGWVSPSL